MARARGADRGIYEETETCLTCSGAKCEECRRRRKPPCPACPCSSCSACGGKGKRGTGSWGIRYANPDNPKREIREVVGTRAMARAAYHARKLDIRAGKFGIETVGRKPKPQGVTVNDLCDRYAATHAVVQQDYLLSIWRKRWGERLALSITRQDVDEFRAELRRTHSISTVNRYMTVAKTVYSWAHKSQIIPTNPLAGLPELKGANSRIRYMTPEEQTAIKRAMCARRPEMWQWVLIAIGTGLRIGEQLALRWEDLDFRADVIYLRRTKAQKAQTIPMRHDVRRLLEGLPRLSQWCFPSPNDPTVPCPYKTLHTSWVRACVDAGLPEDSLKWHDLRHTFGSRLAMAGVPILDISKLMRHSTVAMTMRYAHLAPSALRASIERFELEPSSLPSEAEPSTNGKPRRKR